MKSIDDVMIDLADRRELFIDRYLIDTLHGADLRLHAPRDEGPALHHDKSWEGDFSFSSTAIDCGDVFRLYYRGWPLKADGSFDRASTCVAESEDGIHWRRPELSLFEVRGEKVNNVIATNALYAGNFAPMLDPRDDIPANQRFKSLSGSTKTGLHAAMSADGIHWEKMHENPVFPPQETVTYDSQNITFWSEHEQCYICYFRTNRAGIRRISRATSDDYLHWSQPVEMRYVGGCAEQFYTAQTFPYCRAPHLYLSLAARFMPGRHGVTGEAIKSLGVHPDYCVDTSDTVLMTTRGGDVYDRTFMESYLRAGLGYENWVSRTNYAGQNILQTGDGKLSIYVSQDYAQTTAHLRRYSLPLDRFASLHAGYDGGQMTSKHLKFSGKMLELNYATSAAGSVRVELQDFDGTAVEGFSAADCDEIFGNELSRVVTWGGKSDLSAWADRPVRLRLILKDADVFALRFAVTA